MKKLTTITFLIFFMFNSFAAEFPTSARSEKAISMVEPTLKVQLSDKGLRYGAPIFIRIFKDPGILEVWVESDDDTFIHFKNYEICTFSGDFGPKLKEGDNQSPEGFYYVNASRLNPWSSYHLSFNLGFPNKYDRAHNRTGSALMVHGNCVSIGCYAMTDEYINEIYALAAAALKSGQPFFRVHSFPFKLDDEILSKYRANQWYSFWLNLKEGYDYFNTHKQPPNVEVSSRKYTFENR
ncbi:murein L,D-transpeptidase [Pseudoalteromonas sp. SG45-5]|uniref:L,D-transpeptidase family protein n=1 Tax=unclassified Pseudoalteromonas TaxID=194690 RepID=UPI0015FBF735|nr:MULTISPECIES: murein L,D-transpeptidase family protein [unclassified Pseudoalteromonas]MBB1386716.1 murein L,D-transpeptidase [Pseudoalteromonas sp. SG45-5]MBB1394745.1 murein L,D-transpeptidase [Pseudoalteromonas sp. SG44-4]MBB1446954.1 murein L,D-transpeptidase [Pseudoalteromonas sp. SG41-6]